MKTWEALKIADEGGKVRRETWEKGLYLCKYNGRYVRRYEYSPIILETDVIGDINNNNWEMF
jgi:hypothetical protein